MNALLSTLTRRNTYLLITLGCCGLMAIGLHMQYNMDLIPCALCVTQRIFIILVGIIALIGFTIPASGISNRIVASLGVLSALIGGGFSSRQLWLQSLPPEEAPACGPSLGYLMENFPFQEAFSLLLRGDGNCSEVVWTFLGVSIPGWTLVAFLGLALLNLWQLVRK